MATSVPVQPLGQLVSPFSPLSAALTMIAFAVADHLEPRFADEISSRRLL